MDTAVSAGREHEHEQNYVNIVHAALLLCYGVIVEDLDSDHIVITVADGFFLPRHSSRCIGTA